MVAAQHDQRREPEVVDHRFVQQVLRWLRSSTDEGAIKAVLDDLAGYLTTHFSAEEGPGGLFEVVLAAAPRYSHVVDDLRRQHVTLLAEVKRMADPLVDRPARAETSVLTEVEALVKAIEAHEAREERLLQESVERDIGQGDG